MTGKCCLRFLLCEVTSFHDTLDLRILITQNKNWDQSIILAQNMFRTSSDNNKGASFVGFLSQIIKLTLRQCVL